MYAQYITKSIIFCCWLTFTIQSCEFVIHLLVIATLVLK